VTSTARGVRRERQERTREQLLEAAARVFARHGFNGASVPQIAEAAGVSTGAIYSNFSGKEELFLAMMERVAIQGADRRASVIAEGDEPRDRLLARMARDWVDTVDHDPDTVLLMVEFWLYAIRRPDILDLVASFLAEVRSGFEDTIDQFGERERETRRDLATAMQALAYGFAMQRLTDPEAVTPAQFVRALDWLVAGAERGPHSA
jgi:AcrR family transcriptional regulator